MANRSAATWDALKPGYRSRLERRGVTRDVYLSGANLAGARGHAATPERPSRATPERYPEYVAKRRQRIIDVEPISTLRDRVTAYVWGMLGNAYRHGDIARADLERVSHNIDHTPRHVLVRMLTMSLQDWREEASLGADHLTIRYTDADGELWEGNPFFYH